MKISHWEIITAAQDYIDWANSFHRAYPGPNYISHHDPELYEAYHRMDRAERAMNVACYVVELPPVISIKAARIVDRAYTRACDQGRNPNEIDARRLIESLIENL